MAKSRLGKLAGAAAAWAAWKTADTVLRTREGARDIAHGGRFGCAHCGKHYPTLARWKAHAHSHMPRWTSKKSREFGRKIGKDEDRKRRMGRDGLEGYGLRDRSGKHTARALSRPSSGDGRRHLTRQQLRDLHRHHRDHERADTRDRKAQALRARDKHDRASRHEQAAQALRARHPQLREAPAPRTRPARTAASGRTPANGHRTPAPARLPSRPVGRLAPQPARDGNGRTPARTPANGRTP